jgi:hypothetical protein
MSTVLLIAAGSLLSLIAMGVVVGLAVVTLGKTFVMKTTESLNKHAEEESKKLSVEQAALFSEKVTLMEQYAKLQKTQDQIDRTLDTIELLKDRMKDPNWADQFEQGRDKARWN